MTHAKALKILAISGSLKTSSANSRLVRVLAAMAGTGTEVTIYTELDQLPHFNPDKEEGNPAVAHFRKLLKAADGVIISTPEYAFGVPGTLKNALDWTVSSGELNEKPVIALSASPMYEGGRKAMTSLLLTLGALGTRMTERSHLSIPDILRKLDAEGRVTDTQLQADLEALWQHLLDMIPKPSVT